MKKATQMLTFLSSIPITIQPLFWIMTIVLAWPQSMEELVYLPTWIAVVTVSILIHEFGHALTAKAFGHSVQIELNGMGGLARHDGPRLSLLKEFIVVLNGPLAGFALYWISSFVLHKYGNSLANPIKEMLYMSIWVNLNWTLLNLVPVYPLDGGQMTRILLQGAFGVRGVRISIMLSMAVGGCLCLYFFMEQSIYLATLFLFLTFESYKSQGQIEGMTGTDQGEEMQKTLRNVQVEMRYGNQESAKLKLMDIRETTKSERGQAGHSDILHLS
jgi:Zn-dependent protease